MIQEISANQAQVLCKHREESEARRMAEAEYQAFHVHSGRRILRARGAALHERYAAEGLVGYIINMDLEEARPVDIILEGGYILSYDSYSERNEQAAPSEQDRRDAWNKAIRETLGISESSIAYLERLQRERNQPDIRLLRDDIGRPLWRPDPEIISKVWK